MRQTWIAAAALLAAAGFAQCSWAVWVDSAELYNECGYYRNTPCDSTVQYIRRGYHRNVMWPWPYVCPDRIAVREPFAIMVNNGWRRQNLLGPHHFNADSNQLTTAGELRVRWIMTQAPAERRSIFIERALEPDVTAQRLETVREYATHVAIDDQPPQVFESNLLSEGRPASVVDATNVRFQESMPPPVLPPLVGADTAQ